MPKVYLVKEIQTHGQDILLGVCPTLQGEYRTMSYAGTEIKEINLYNNESEIMQYGIEYR